MQNPYCVTKKCVQFMTVALSSFCVRNLYLLVERGNEMVFVFYCWTWNDNLYENTNNLIKNYLYFIRCNFLVLLLTGSLDRLLLTS